jgi:hypothetical protein
VRTSDFTPGLAIGPLTLAAREVPHVTLETNRTCNMRCRLCYNLDRDYVKSADEVAADLETAMRLRHLAAVTVLGGEPTLYPGLAEVIAEVKGHGLFCALLTNGLRFLDGDGPGLIDRIRKAGADRIYVHVDSGQGHVHADVEAAREKMFRLLEAAGVPFALSVTLYGGESEALAGIVRRYSRFRHFEGVLATLPHDPSGGVGEGMGPSAAGEEAREEARGEPRRSGRPAGLKGVYEELRAGLGLEPLSFIPGDSDDGDVRWLIYFYIVNARTGAAFAVSPKVQRLAQRLFRWAPGEQFFAQTLGAEYIRSWRVPILLAELAFSPRRAVELIKLLRGHGPRGRGIGGSWLKDLRAQFITIQAPPGIDFERGQASVCRHCPDATVRTGKLVPVCIADLVSPLNPMVRPRLACPPV